MHVQIAKEDLLAGCRSQALSRTGLRFTARLDDLSGMRWPEIDPGSSCLPRQPPTTAPRS
jgi:hypothetical protein